MAKEPVYATLVPWLRCVLMPFGTSTRAITAERYRTGGTPAVVVLVLFLLIDWPFGSCVATAADLVTMDSAVAIQTKGLGSV